MRRAGNRRTQLPPLARWRPLLVLGLFVVATATLAGRAFYLQVLDHEFLVKRGQHQYLHTIAVPANRGAIVDRHGSPLALSAPTETVWAVPGAVLKAPQKIASLAAKLGTTARKLDKRLHRHANSRFMYLARQLPPYQARAIRSLDMPGVFFKRVYKRYYPTGPAAAQLVGLTNIDGKGLAGVEMSANATLKGVPGQRRVIKDRVGRIVDDLDEFKPPKPGGDVKLTIDSRLQSIAYNQLKKAVEAHKAKDGVVVMLNPRNGQLLAMASYPSFNPNNRHTISPAAMRMRAATDIMEPGSSIKPLLISGALQQKAITLTDTIKTHGWWRVGNVTIHDDHNYGVVNVARILKKSSNIGAAHIGLRMGAQDVWRDYKRFGLGQKTNINFPGRRVGDLKPFTRWGKVETATASYGYGVGVTPLQLIRAYGAIANHGMLPTLKLIEGAGGHMAVPPRRVIAARTAAIMRRLLEGVVSSGGTAERAKIPGYVVAGKTGTARKLTSHGYTRKEHRAIFVGMAPAANPAIVTLVMVDRPTKGSYFGGTVAAPVFKIVTQSALHILHVPPSSIQLVSDDNPGDKATG